MNRIIKVNDNCTVALIQEKACGIGLGQVPHSIVLCAILSRKEYVTWIKLSSDSMHSGHYFQSLNEAIKDYNNRS